MTWDLVDIAEDDDPKVWMIPDSKSDRPHRITLVPAAVKVLESLRLLNGHRKHVFASNVKPSVPVSGKSMTDVYKRLRESTKIEDWQGLHDLRTAVVTHAAESGYCPPHLAEILLNHGASMSGATKSYLRASYFQDAKETLEKWAMELQKIVSQN